MTLKEIIKTDTEEYIKSKDIKTFIKRQCHETGGYYVSITCYDGSQHKTKSVKDSMTRNAINLLNKSGL